MPQPTQQIQDPAQRPTSQVKIVSREELEKIVKDRLAREEKEKANKPKEQGR